MCCQAARSVMFSSSAASLTVSNRFTLFLPPLWFSFVFTLIYSAQVKGRLSGAEKGETREEAVANIREAMAAYVESLRDEED